MIEIIEADLNTKPIATKIRSGISYGPSKLLLEEISKTIYMSALLYYHSKTHQSPWTDLIYDSYIHLLETYREHLPDWFKKMIGDSQIGTAAHSFPLNTEILKDAEKWAESGDFWP